MAISDALQRAWDLINQPNAHSRRAGARDVDGEPVHALDETARSWCSVSALQKVLGEVEGPTFNSALGCLQMGALKVSPLVKGRSGGRGVVEINDHGTESEVQAMWAFALQTARAVEAQLSPVEA